MKLELKNLSEKLKMLAILAVLILPFYSCKDTKLEIPIPSATIDLGNVLVGGGPSSVKGVQRVGAGDLISFNETDKVITMDDIKGLTDQALEYKSRISEIEIGTASITITAPDDATGTEVKDFVLDVTGVGKLEIPQYNLGTSYAAEDVVVFAKDVLAKLLSDDEITVSISGKTDVTSGKNLNVRIKLDDMKLIADLLQVLN